MCGSQPALRDPKVTAAVAHPCCLLLSVSRNQTAQKAQSQFCSDGTVNRKCQKKEDFSRAEPRSNRTDWSLINTSIYPFKLVMILQILTWMLGYPHPTQRSYVGIGLTHTHRYTHAASLKLKRPLNADIYNRNQWATVYSTCDMCWWVEQCSQPNDIRFAWLSRPDKRLQTHRWSLLYNRNFTQT